MLDAYLLYFNDIYACRSQAKAIAGHVSPPTTLIYEEPPEEVLQETLKNLE